MNRFIVVILLLSAVDASNVIEFPIYVYNVTKYFIIFPVLDCMNDFYTQYPLLPDDIENFDAFGNFLVDPRTLLRSNYYSQRMNNYTEKFKEMYEHLFTGRGVISNDGWVDRAGIMKSPDNKDFALMNFDLEENLREAAASCSIDEIEKSAEYWEFNGLEGDYFIESMPKTQTSFPHLKIPKRSRYAHVLETYLIDLCRMFYPYLEEGSLNSLEDLLALTLFHLYIYLKDDDRLYRAYVNLFIEDLRSMGTILSLPKPGGYLNRMSCLRRLFRNVLKFNCIYTFKFMLHSGILDLKSSSLLKQILSCQNQELVKYFLSVIDRNSDIKSIGPQYHGKLCHAVYWSENDWLMVELLKYDDVDWNLIDSRGYTVLGYMVHKRSFDERFRLFLKHTNNFILCYRSASHQRNIVEECFALQENVNDRRGFRGLSKFVTYLRERQFDDFSPLLLTAALNKRPDYFDRILNERTFNSCHELDAAFQLIYQHMGFDRKFLYEYLTKILIKMQECHGSKGHRLEHLFFMKWQIQLAQWKAAVDEMGI